MGCCRVNTCNVNVAPNRRLTFVRMTEGAAAWFVKARPSEVFEQPFRMLLTKHEARRSALRHPFFCEKQPRPASREGYPDSGQHTANVFQERLVEETSAAPFGTTKRPL